MKTVVLIGDSIRMGYQETVRARLSDCATIWAPEENGGNSERVRANLAAWALSRRPDAVHINCGLHDIRKEFGQTAPAVPLERYSANLRSILGELKAAVRGTVVWAATTPVNQDWHHKNKDFDRFEADVAAYNAAAATVCRELDVPVNDLFALVQARGPDTLLARDGVHFSEEGYTLLGARVAECLRPFLGAP